MASTNVFALPESDLNGFLFSAIGTEQNGLSLTVLSALARLGEDPWAQAASWASMSKDAASDALASCIAQMPLSPKDLQNAPATAARLVALLFKQNSALSLVSKVGTVPARVRFSPILIAYIIIGIGTAVALAAFVTTHGPIARWRETSQTDQKAEIRLTGRLCYRTKNAIVATAITRVANQPPIPEWSSFTDRRPA